MPTSLIPIRFLSIRELDLGTAASGTIVVDLGLARETLIIGTQTGNLTIQFANAAKFKSVSADIEQGGAGGFTLAFTLLGGTVVYPANQSFAPKITAGATNTFAGLCVSGVKINANSSPY